MKHKFLIFLIFILSCNSSNFAQKQSLAKIGNTILSVDEFNQRYELTPKVKSDFHSDSSKVNFLYSLIAEKLWALEAQSLSMDTISYVRNSIKNIERKLVKDKLYKIEIENKVKITDRDISEGLLKLNEKRVMNFLFSKSKKEIEKLYKKLLSGESIDSLLVDRGEQNQQLNGITVVYGQMDEHLEEAIFSLLPKQFTEPLYVKVGWVIYYLKKIEPNEIEQSKNERAKIKKVEDIIFTRKAKAFYNEFFDKYIKGNVVYSDKRLFNLLLDKIFEYLNNSMANLYNEKIKKYQLDNYQIKNIANRFLEKDLNSDFIKFKTSPISLKKYLLNLELNGFSCNEITKEDIKKALSSNVKAFIFEEMLFREGYARGLQNSADIRKELKIWHESFLASYYRHTFLDSIKIDDDKAKEFYNKIVLENDNSVTESFDVVEEKIKKGIYFKELENLYIDKTVALSEKYGVFANTELLNSIEVTDIEMMVYRTLGFGGKISAVPYLQPFYKWKYWLPKSIKNPFQD